MSTSDILSVLAVIISGLSFALSFLALRSDRGILKAWCEFHLNYHKALEGDPELHVYAVNAGKREMTLKYLLVKQPKGVSKMFLKQLSVVKDEQGNVVSVPDILEHEIGVSLTEGRMHHLLFSSDDWTNFYDETGLCDQLYFEDSIGRKHKVKNPNGIIGKYVETSQAVARSKGLL